VIGISSLYVYTGIHTVNSRGELIYIDSKRNINKLSTDNTTVTTMLEYTSPWRPHSVYCSPTTGQLMVAMYNPDTHTAKVTLYSNLLHPALTIQHDNTGHSLYRAPLYITENRNSDIIVSDLLRGVVVTEHGGGTSILLHRTSIRITTITIRNLYRRAVTHPGV
jgi:hypothetical protein